VKDNWDRAVSVATIASLLAVPLVVAFGSWKLQKQLAEQTNVIQEGIARQTSLTERDIAALNVQVDYVNLAINILRDQPTKTPRPLREWAVAILAQNSPVKLSDEMQKALLSEPLRVPAAGSFSRTSFGPGFGAGFGEFGQPPGYQPPGYHYEPTQPTKAKPRGQPGEKQAE
jgi:hypothetical protein